jgi:hypothetical protein
MTRYTNHDVDTLIQVLNADGSPAVSATVNCVVRDWNGEQESAGAMTHQANGIFRYIWQTDRSGHFTAECICENPIFRHTFEYYVIPWLQSRGYASTFNYELATNETNATLLNIEMGPSANQPLCILFDLRNCSKPKRFVLDIDFMYWNDGGVPAVVRNWPEDYPAGTQVVCIITPPITYKARLRVEVDEPEVSMVHILGSAFSPVTPIADITQAMTYEED